MPTLVHPRVQGEGNHNEIQAAQNGVGQQNQQRVLWDLRKQGRKVQGLRTAGGNLRCSGGGMAESVDARDLKSLGPKGLWGFKSPCPHHLSSRRQQLSQLGAEISLGHAALKFSLDRKISIGIVHQEVGGPAHPLLVGVLLEQDLPVFAIHLRVLQHHGDEAAAEFLGHLAVVVTHAVTGAAVFRAELDQVHRQRPRTGSLQHGKEPVHSQVPARDDHAVAT